MLNIWVLSCSSLALMMSLDALVRISSNKMDDGVEEVERKMRVMGGGG